MYGDRLKMMYAQQNARDEYNAKEYFESKTELNEKIIDEIFPTLLAIRGSHGVVGTAFYRFPEWLVSNAHVFPTAESVEGSFGIGFEGNMRSFAPERSFHRPVGTSAVAPDITVINQKTDGIQKCLGPGLNGDSKYKEKYFFYVDVNDGYSIKFLQFFPTGCLPHFFRCVDGASPKPGTSGSPIICAEVIMGSKPQWYFTLFSVLYARCNHKAAEVFGVRTDSTALLVCGVPVGSDFEQIRLDILIPDEQAVRSGMMSSAAESLKDTNKTREYTRAQEYYQKLAENGTISYTLGITPLGIELPDGLEPLRGYSKLKESNLIKTKKCTLGELQEDYDDFVNKVRRAGEIKLHTANNFDHSQNKYFRIDVCGGGDRPFYLQIQDNTGYSKTSSVFCSANCAPGQKSIMGDTLALLFEASYKDGEAKKINESGQPVPVASSNKGKKAKKPAIQTSIKKK